MWEIDSRTSNQPQRATKVFKIDLTTNQPYTMSVIDVRNKEIDPTLSPLHCKSTLQLIKINFRQNQPYTTPFIDVRNKKNDSRLSSLQKSTLQG